MSILESQKDELIHGIEKMFFDGNFGSASKTDIEIFMFHQYMEVLRAEDKEKTNYQIAKNLGITLQKVVSLKEREASKYPYNSNQWKKLLLDNMKYVKADGDDFTLLVTDRRLFREVESFLEEKNIGIKYARNSNMFIANFDLLMQVFDNLFDGEDINIFKETKDNILDQNSVTLDELKKLGTIKLLSFIKELAFALLPLII